MKAIITMAGASSRFKKEGFIKPKYELLCNGRTIFEWAMLSLKDWFETIPFVFVIREDDRFINNMCKVLGIKNWSFVYLEELTSGQGETVLYALSEEDEPIAIYNIDTYVKQLGSLEIPKAVDGWIPVFSAEGTHWSFTLSNEHEIIIDIAEKVRISEWATVGLYYFHSSRMFKKYYQLTYQKNNGNETYIAPIYKTMIEHGATIKETRIASSENIIPLGTPAEAIAFDLKFQEVNLIKWKD
ncbi:hypothetical protein M3649_16805 [Ureibacillus chungkukjangi]|uniref:hypothetical protein n=1 Tax=Ureibacillus chungkukjangi TaxID=1202712 RepID=UPI00203DEBA2|nr:hypothetical protein [Ureibacillus chungkukjangi]MCM3389781.1 hypothetical protein [Ureibacillus chungkukjangi]